ncbi:MAG: pantoate--beta-alanine ligase [Planctomycetota bacterium]
MDTVTTSTSIRDWLDESSCVLVPTMGALHEGHLSLVECGRKAAARLGCPLVVSVFVNPDQFNDPSDLDAYPRPLAEDLRALEAHGVDVAFVPSVEAMYPEDEPGAAPQPEVPAVGRLPGLEDRFRPGHFPGVCRVVSRLFDLCRPAEAVFGEKDWQQAQVVTAMCREQQRDIRILVAPTVRESDGLAMSSRNQHLSREARARAAAIWRGFDAARLESAISKAEAVIGEHMESAGFAVEYASIRDESTLMVANETSTGPLRMLAAGVLEGVRLLDNAPWPA